MTTLDDLALTTNTDRSSCFHDYFSFYEQLLEHFKDKPITLLEQGVLSGDGLRTWNQWFTHPKAKLWGIDIEDHFDPAGYSRIEVRHGSQADPQFMFKVIEEIGKDIDICICDAGHFADQQWDAFKILWPHIAKGGFYCIEDTHAGWSPQHTVHGPGMFFRLQLMAEEIQTARGADACGKKIEGEKWYDIDYIIFRKSLCIVKRID